LESTTTTSITETWSGGCREGAGAAGSEVPGVVFLETDGLAHEVLVHAIRNGEVPHIAHWLRHGTHRLLRWETDWSSQTDACQTGLLHGSNDDMPASAGGRRSRVAPS
jgi:hypothetical protein